MGTFLVLRQTSENTAYSGSRTQAVTVREEPTAHPQEPGNHHYRPLIILLVTYSSKVKNANFFLSCNKIVLKLCVNKRDVSKLERRPQKKIRI